MKSEPALTVPFIRLDRINGPQARRRAGWAALSVSLALLGQPAGASPVPTKTVDKQMDARTDTVTVTASRTIPHVQSTFPALGAKVAPGLLVLRVTYDTKMRPEGWSYAEDAAADYPDCGSEGPRLLDDRRSFVLICRTLPGKHYAVWFNRPPMNDFSSMGRRPAVPFQLKFQTTDDEPVRTLAEAMKADAALSSLSNPVEPDGMATYGQQDAPGTQ